MTPETFLLAIVILAGATDLAARRIPNALPLTGLGVALAFQLAGAHGSALAWLAGAGTGLCLFLPFYLMRGMAAGDVKLMAAVGSFVGPALALKIGLLAFITGGLMGAAMLLSNGRVRACLRNVRILCRAWPRLAGARAPLTPAIASVGGIPYAVAIALATLGVLVWEHA
jgi:prepilin peptidase CpaA